jgi:hypothetical protein
MSRKFFCLLLLNTCLINAAWGAGFSAMVSPPRFELHGKPGEIIREIVDIENAGDIPAVFSIRTADWDLSEAGGLTIFPAELQSGSCRPWARLERRSIRLQPQSGKRFRFELHLPEQAPAGECRLAILVEPGDDESVLARARNIRFPVEGRIAIIIYVTVGDATPVLTLHTLKLQEVNGRLTPVAVLENTGNAHGRPDGFLQGKDASGKKIDFIVAQTPILPGQTRPVTLWQATAEGEEAITLTAPLQVKGVIGWEGGQHKVDTTLE